MAQQFRFRLETVRKLRSQARDRQRRIVAEAVQHVVRNEEHIAQVNRELRSSLDDALSDRSAMKMDVAALRENQLYRGWLHRKILDADIELTKSNSVVNQERSKLVEATKRLKVLEKLRERQWNRYQTKLKRAEQMMYDEASLQMFVRRSRLQDQEVRT